MYEYGEIIEIGEHWSRPTRMKPYPFAPQIPRRMAVDRTKFSTVGGRQRVVLNGKLLERQCWTVCFNHQSFNPIFTLYLPICGLIYWCCLCAIHFPIDERNLNNKTQLSDWHFCFDIWVFRIQLSAQTAANSTKGLVVIFKSSHSIKRNFGD